jgi:hypothetical protein
MLSIRRIQPGISSKNCVLVVVIPVTWRVLVLTRGRRKTSPPEVLVFYEGDKPGGERCAVRTAGSETGVQRCIPSVDGDKIGAVAVVQSETGTELGSSDPAVKSRSRTGEP